MPVRLGHRLRAAWLLLRVGAIRRVRAAAARVGPADAMAGGRGLGAATRSGAVAGEPGVEGVPEHEHVR
jgi:hypothetical protein